MKSKELLSEVLDVLVIRNSDRDGSNELFLDVFERGTLKINKYELAHKCKEWAKGFNYLCSSFYSFKVNSNVCDLYQARLPLKDYNGQTDFIETFKADTEPEAVFKACEWIMENKNDK